MSDFVKHIKYYTWVVIYSFLLANNANADVYMDFTNTLLSTSELLGADQNQSRERYIVLNGTPITTRIYQVNLNHQDAIKKLSIELLKNHNKNILEEKYTSSTPAATVTEDWSVIYGIDLSQLGKVVTEKELLNNNYIMLAKKISSNKSMVFDLQFKSVKDMKNLLFTIHEDVGCDEKLAIARYPASRRKFCLTELTSEKVISQVVIYEGLGNPATRISHYQNQLADLNYQFDVVDKQSSNKSILFAANKYSSITVFTYKSKNKVLDVIQSQF